jgi:hypothetical protein
MDNIPLASKVADNSINLISEHLWLLQEDPI